jgi:hypothetical protein
VTEVVANNHDATITTNDFALVADLLNAWLNLHDLLLLLVTIDNATSGEVIWTEFNDHTIFGKNANIVLSHLAADMCKHYMSIC